MNLIYSIHRYEIFVSFSYDIRKYEQKFLGSHPLLRCLQTSKCPTLSKQLWIKKHFFQRFLKWSTPCHWRLWECGFQRIQSWAWRFSQHQSVGNVKADVSRLGKARAPERCCTQAILANIRLGCEGMPGTYTIPY